MAVALPIISLAATAVGAGVSALGAMQQGKAQAAAANYNAQVARNAALYAKQKGEVEAQAKQRQTAALIARQRAAYAAGNIDVNSGSPLDIQADTATLGKLDELTIKNNAAREAWAAESQANLMGAEASAANRAGEAGAIGSLIGGAASLGSKWAEFQSSGVFDPSMQTAFGMDSGIGIQGPGMARFQGVF